MRRGRDADVERQFSSVDPVVDEDVSRTRKGARNEAREFLLRIEGSPLCRSEDDVADSVMAAALQPMIVVAMKSVVSEVVLGDGAGGSTTVTRLHERDTQTIP